MEEPAQGASDHSLVGRPVVFVRPPSVVQTELLGQLIRNEYSVAVLADHTKVRDLVRRFPRCIVFVNLEEGYTEAEWEALVREIQTGPDTSEVRLGIVGYHADAELSHKYLFELSVPCGFIKLSLGLDESTQTLLKVLEANEAKGRRQFLRVPCKAGWASLNVVNAGKATTGTVVDISIVGLSCTFDAEPGFVAHSLVKGLQLKLKGMLCTVNVVVMGSRLQDDGNTQYVMLYDAKLPDETKEKIRTFQRKALQLAFDGELGVASSD